MVGQPRSRWAEIEIRGKRGIHKDAALAAGALRDASLVPLDSVTDRAPSLVLDEGVGAGKASNQGGAGDEGAGGADEGEEGSGLDDAESQYHDMQVRVISSHVPVLGLPGMGPPEA